MDLRLQHNLFIGQWVDPEAPDIADLTDVNVELSAFKVIGKADTIEVPPTAAFPDKRKLGGAASYDIELGYLSTDGNQGVLFGLLWDAITDSDTRELVFAGTMRPGDISATNPLWTGTFVVAGAEVGGEAEALSQTSNTFPLTGAPEQITDPADVGL